VKGLDNDHERKAVFRVYERKTVRKIHGPAKEERWRVKRQADKGHIIKGRYCKIYKVPPTRMVW
jgi:hypothetical protein